ncbi:MAG: hypothetical protein ACM3SQ_16135 [Betaproteobacteria bacterium]
MPISGPRINRCARAACASAVVAALAAPAARASTPKFFQAATQADFLNGDLENLSVDSHGRLILGPATELVYETSSPFVWTLLRGSDGALFVGTGNEGKVFRIDAQGKGALFFDPAELEVHALAPAPDGGLFVATSPEGKIYRVDRNGSASTFFDPPEKYIWALAVDPKGNLYAGTGEKATIYRITPDGKGTAIYHANATHVMALAFDPSGDLIAGTGSPGRVVRIDPSGKPFVLLDSPFQEIHSIRLDAKGALYAAALSGTATAAAPPAPTETTEPARTTGSPAPAPVPSVSAEITSIAVVDVAGGASTASTAADHRTPKGAVYRITRDGVWDEIWESRDDTAYDVGFDADGSVLVGTGNKGKIFRLDGDPMSATLLLRAGGQQVTSLLHDSKGQLYYATANPGKLFRVSSSRASRGACESASLDAGMLATWGALSWHGTTPSGGDIQLFTRSGNTETPDEAWSDWSAAYTKPDGSAITSPKARYLQWRAVLTANGSAGPVLTSVTVAYLQRNLRPQVTSVSVQPPGIVFQKPYTTGEPDLAGFDNQTTPERKLQAAAMAAQTGTVAALGRRTYEKGLQTLTWKAEDPNDDDLVYDVLFRREGETRWTTLRHGITDTILVWDTTTVPNGTYFVKVVASDAPSNPASTALSGELESSAFDIDNTPPTFHVDSTRTENGHAIVRFTVQDDHSPIQRVEFSIDGQHWRGVFPLDGIADSKTEQYEVTLDGPLPDRGLVLRATDGMNNVATTVVSR